MRYLFCFCLFFLVAGCVHFKANSRHFEMEATAPTGKPAYFQKVALTESSVQHSDSTTIESEKVESKHEKAALISADSDKPERESIQEKAPTRRANDLALPSTPAPSIKQSQSVDNKHFLDTFFDLKNLDFQAESPTDFSDYGFITPTDSLEMRVNDELKQLRDDTPLSQTDSASNLLDRIPENFQLDLSLDNRRIRNQLNWFVRNPDYLDRTFKRASRYLHYIVQEVEKRDMPMELALLPFVESAYDPFAYSHGRASGLWQFIPGTGKIYGLHQNWWYDGRRDIPASTKAALDYLSYLSKRFDGNWLHALAAYNSGSGRVGKAIKKNKQKSRATDFWSLKLPKETRAYVPKLLAMAKIVANPAQYGISLPPIADTPYFSIVNLDGQLDLAQAASLAEVDINEIYKLNPGFNQWATAPLGPHRLLVPVSQAIPFKSNLKKLSKEKRLTWNRYSVKRGDSLIRIARKFNTTPQLIRQVNHLPSNMIREKQKLLIPIASKGKSYYDLSQQNRLARKQDSTKGSKDSLKVIHTVKPGDTVWDLAQAHRVGVRALAKWNGMAPTDILTPGKKLLIWSKASQAIATPIDVPIVQQRQMIKRIGYRVRRGDSLARIASKFSVSIKELIVWNRLDRKKYLQPGQKLTIFVDLSNT